MGACCAVETEQGTVSKHQARALNMIDEMQKNQAQMVGQTMASAPRVLATGATLIPMNYINGQFPTSYPQSFEKYNISQQIYTQFIKELNAITMSLYSQQKQAQTNFVVAATGNVGITNIKGAQANMMAAVGQVQMQQLQIQQTMAIEVDKLLLRYNQTVFQSNGLQAESSLVTAMTANTSQIGVIVKPIQQQVVYVVQQQPQQAAVEGVGNEAPPSYEEAEPPQYTNQ